MNRDDRPRRTDRPRPDRAGTDRPRGDRPRSSPREGSFGSRPDRGDRPRGAFAPRPDRGDRPRGAFAPRPDRGDRPRGAFSPRPDRGERSDRTPSDRPRRERPSGDRPSSSAREGSFGSRPDRGERPRGAFSPRPESSEHSGGGRFGGGERREKSDFSTPRRDPETAKRAPRSDRPHLAEDELRYLGKNACLALWKNRPDDIIRVYVRREDAEAFAGLIEYCAKNKKSYHLVSDLDLEKLTDSRQHQGVCVVAKTKTIVFDKTFISGVDATRDLILFLDGVANPHNFGGIIRTAAHFGVKTIASPEEFLPRLSAAASRTAEGGAEYVNVVSVRDDENFLENLKYKGYVVYGLESNAEKSQSLYETRLNDKSVFVLGNEETGICGRVRAQLNCSILIPGTGHMESLNVSVAAALAMSEFQRQGKELNRRIVKVAHKNQ